MDSWNKTEIAVVKVSTDSFTMETECTHFKQRRNIAILCVRFVYSDRRF